jgi:two-component system, sporulation sensor kinase E
MKSEFKDNKEAIKELDIIYEEVERANKIVKELMEFANPSKSEAQLYYLNDTINEILLIINTYAIQRNSELEALMADNVKIAADRIYI